MDMNLSEVQETVQDRGPGMLQSMGLQGVGHDLATEQQQKKCKHLNFLFPPVNRLSQGTCNTLYLTDRE